MLIILAFIILFHITSAILLFISSIKNEWWVSKDNTIDLWYHCNSTGCYDLPGSATSEAAYLQTVQAAMILATMLCCVGFFVFILQLFRLKQGERFVFTAIIQLLSTLCVMIGASIYTAEHLNFKDKTYEDGNFGYAFVVAWVAFPMTLLSGLMYLVLRKRK
ncbi:epithelial membrane 2-like protein [Labeo rohita]|uniref:Epithelial membrane protein 2 n=1 Tax=Labeo rohita TaxID=84645 RepID=A0A498M5E3_LABRO|nr:epithelial membrane protein 2 [Labeo rohita]XP_050961911.1 epithelial membrane protein 2 [Labeo rohita]XP_050961912.1 epithelial membrane protein 2 [Labeo rohita]XP_050961913.1 epithelial membrane protein 2 [Labeo rohita]RXN12875.1 epithelial membrane 2-like protein [Labeo rohita]RXN26651.1 epithelial membrane 2-like protein [Labeo rohita]